MKLTTNLAILAAFTEATVAIKTAWDDVLLDEVPVRRRDERRMLEESATVKNNTNNETISTIFPGSDKSDQLIYMNSTLGKMRLLEASSNDDFFAMVADGWDAQVNQAYCSLATTAAVLNSFRPSVDLPIDEAYEPYPYATQGNMFNVCTEQNVILVQGDTQNTSVTSSLRGNPAETKVADGIRTSPFGLTLRQARDFMECQLNPSSWNITMTVADPSIVTMEEARAGLVDAISDKNKRVYMNYYRSGLGQVGGGHFSPVVAYHDESDSFLIMDVAKYKYPPVWASALAVYNALSSDPLDSCGIWNWPNAQENLGKFLTEKPKTEEDFDQVEQILGCQPSHRGFIVVERLV